MPLLHPRQRKTFTIDKPTAEFYAAKLSRGEKIRCQSYANRNWIAKIARIKYGVNTEVYVSKSQLFDPSRTVEGLDLQPGYSHYMNLYCADRVEAPIRMPFNEQIYKPTITVSGSSYNRREDYVR